MNKTAGLIGMIVVIALITIIVEPKFNQSGVYIDLGLYTGLYGILAIGAGLVIMTGGIDLSMGSLVGLSATLFPLLMKDTGADMSAFTSFICVMLVALAIGLVHGLLITKLNLQPFIVTLCGLFVYRGIARTAADGRMQGLGSSAEAESLMKISTHELFGVIPMPLIYLLLLGVVAAIFLNKTTYGTYLLALGRNEKAALYSGVNTQKIKIMAYVMCSATAGLGGVLFALKTNSVDPASYGNFYELFAIAGAVLGGCSLRGGYGTITGIILGSCLVQLIEKSAIFMGVSSESKFTVIGVIILLGVMADEVLGGLYKKKKLEQARALDNGENESSSD